ncbi:MAG: hypothetical protein NPINA01_09900 [Nitrospinaceae bacterium]|nr:MAG: hypothetical protein NPINA01_09900 [Nitrospinaceae bacterium]
MLCRVASSLYWMSSYLERAENVARFIDVNLSTLLDLSLESELGNPWEPLIQITGDNKSFHGRYEAVNGENVMKFHTFDEENPNSILSCLIAARENARTIRETIPSEMWEQINKLYLMVKGVAHNGSTLYGLTAFYKTIKMDCHLFSGITDATMAHTEAWDFVQLGQLIERADKTSRILDVKYFLLLPRVDYVGSTLDKIQWAALLKSASALEAYRKKYRQINPSDVAEFLILDYGFPRSMIFCLTQSYRSLFSITRSAGGDLHNLPERRLGKLRAKLDYTTIEEIIQLGLHEYLDEFQMELNTVVDAIHETYFVPNIASLK